RQLSSEGGLDDAEHLVIASAIRTEDAFVALGDDGESSMFTVAQRTLELRHTPWTQNQSAVSDRLAVDLDHGNGAQRTVIAEPEPVHLPRPGEDVPGLELANLALVVGHDFDGEITNTHDDTPRCGTMKSTST